MFGGTGQLGSNLVRALIDRGDEVRVLVRPRSHLITLAGLTVERVEGDLNDVDSVSRACKGMEIVYHAAAYYPPSTISASRATSQAVSETKNILEAVRRAVVLRLVFASTLTTIGFPNGPNRLADETCPFATSYQDNPYLMAKAAMEHVMLEAATTGVPVVVVNPTAFFGPYDSKPTSGTQILMIAERLMPVYVDGPVNVIDARDVAVGMIRAAERGQVGERYILGNLNTTQRQLNELITRLAGVPAPFVPLPFHMARYGAKCGDWAFRTVLRKPAPVPGFFVEMLRHMQHYNCSKGIRQLEYPRHPIDTAICDALTWFRQNGYLPAS